MVEIDEVGYQGIEGSRENDESTVRDGLSCVDRY